MSTGCYTVRAQRAYPAPCVSPRWAAPHRGFLLPKKNRPSQPCPCMACGRFRYWLPEGPAGPCDRLATKSGLRIIASTMNGVYSVFGSSVKRTGEILRQTYAIEDRSLPGKHRVNVGPHPRLATQKGSISIDPTSGVCRSIIEGCRSQVVSGLHLSGRSGPSGLLPRWPHGETQSGLGPSPTTGMG